MTPAPADRPCGCDQSQALTQDLADARSQLEAHAEDNRELFARLAAANARVAELEAGHCACKDHGVLVATQCRQEKAEKERDHLAAELAALRSRLDPGVPENVRRVARALESSFRARHTDLADGCWFEDAAAALKAALDGGG